MEYQPPWWLRNGHVQSIYPALFRKEDASFLFRERIETPDGDFLDLDWGRQGSGRLLVLSHGLEGNSRRPYMLGMMRHAMAAGWDVLAWNFRSCSGEPNRKLSSYHSGQTHDLAQVVQYGLQAGYSQAALVGFSIGGNKTLLYLGREPELVPKEVKAAVVFSVPTDLKSSAEHLAAPKSFLYMKNFLDSFALKLSEKEKLFPGQIDLEGFSKIRTFREYDERYTSPMNGFGSAQEYWRASSSRFYLPGIQIPTLMVSALDDPFLTQACFAEELIEKNPSLLLETPKYGGHVGFMPGRKELVYWSEKRALSFLGQFSDLIPC